MTTAPLSASGLHHEMQPGLSLVWEEACRGTKDRGAPVGASGRTPSPAQTHCLPIHFPPPLDCCCSWLSNTTAEIHLPFKSNNSLRAFPSTSPAKPSLIPIHPNEFLPVAEASPGSQCVGSGSCAGKSREAEEKWHSAQKEGEPTGTGEG